MNKLSASLWLRRKLTRRVRLTAALFFAFILIGGLLFFLPSVAPRYLFTLEEKFTVLTPAGFTLGQLYNFDNFYQEEAKDTQTAGKNLELVLPRPDNHT
ncbi:MAG: hypothetical protein N2376_07050, partial [Clostridia bacterium]|nr:hypothetical protein [Clostridia bacterium]